METKNKARTRTLPAPRTDFDEAQRALMFEAKRREKAYAHALAAGASRDAALAAYNAAK